MESQPNLVAKFAPKLIYIADSNIDVSRSIEMLLKADEVLVSIFETGRALLSTTIATPPSCIVVDSSLPDIDGLTLLDRLKDQDPRIPVILIFTNGYESMDEGVRVVVQALKAGAWDCFEKPFIQQKLIDSVERAIQQDQPH